MIYSTPQLLTLQTKRAINRPMITVQMVATPNRTGLTLHMLRDKHVIQLKGATLVGVSARPAGTMVPFDMWKSEAMVKVHRARRQWECIHSVTASRKSDATVKHDFLFANIVLRQWPGVLGVALVVPIVLRVLVSWKEE